MGSIFFLAGAGLVLVLGVILLAFVLLAGRGDKKKQGQGASPSGGTKREDAIAKLHAARDSMREERPDLVISARRDFRCAQCVQPEVVMKNSIGMLLLLLLLCGCEMPTIPIMDDKPVVETEVASPDASLVAGPYVSSVDASQAKVCFVTDNPVSTALVVSRPGFQRTIRGGEPSRFHVLDLNHLAPGRRYECAILINHEEKYRFPLRTFPAGDESVRLALLSGGALDRDVMKSFGEQIRESAPLATVLLGSQVEDVDLTDQWYAGLFPTESSVFAGMNIIHAPDLPGMSAATARDLFPAQVMDQSFVSRVGEVDLIFLAQVDLNPSRRFRLDHWLSTTLNLSKARWKIVLLSPPLMTSMRPKLNFSLLESFAPLFEKHGVSLVLSSLAPFYHRSAFVGSEVHSLPYISLPQLTTQTDVLPAADELTAYQATTPAVTFIDVAAGRLYLSVYDQAGVKLDSMILGSEPRAAEDRLSRIAMLDRARAVVIQSREMKAIARQAVRAVSNPENPASLQFLLANPSPLPFRGTLQWDQEGTRFSVSPKQVPFALDPGAGARSVFQVTPEEGGKGMPELVVLCDERSPVRQPLFLVPQVFYSLPVTDREITVDGRPGEKTWKQGVSLTLTGNLHGNPSPSRGARVRMLAGREALYITYRCPLDPEMPATRVAMTRDEPVWKDESVELFIDPEGRGRRFYQFAVSIHGVTLDAGMETGLGWNPKWRQAIE
ncbi:MAG: hypothetical protein ACYTGH_19875, partial [Planctomycetota bacterium]